MPVSHVLRAASLAVAVTLAFGNAAEAKTLRFSSQGDITTIDPHSANLLATSRLTANVYEPLVWRDPEWKLIPWLATSWTQPNDRTWRFRLREGVKFHDGSPFTADDVVFSFGRIKQPQGTMQIYVTGISEVKKVDDHTVDLILAGPNPILLRNIYFFHGLAVLLFYLNKYRVPPWMRFGVYALVLLQQFLVIGVTMAGLFDQWLDLDEFIRKNRS